MPRTLKCMFGRYTLYQKEYRYYHPPTRRMFITMDVVFHEDTMYYSKSKFHGEYLDEIQTFEYSLMTDTEEINMDVTELSDKYSGDLDTSGQNVDISGNPENQETSGTPEAELYSLPSNIPNQSLADDTPYIVPESSRRQLPQRHTRGIPKSTYEPELSSKVRYPMSHYVSTHQLSKTNQSFVNQLSTVSIPNSVQ